MTRLVCDECGDNFEAESLDHVTKDPTTGEALCKQCEEVECLRCRRDLNISELSSANKHEGGGWACDTCYTKELPWEFDITYRREIESKYPLGWMMELFADVSENPQAISREFWRFREHVTYRVTESGVEAVALNGNYIGDTE